MDSEEQFWFRIMLIVGVLLLGLLAVGLRGCQIQSEHDTKVLTECLKAGRSPLECKAMTVRQ